MCDCFKAHDSNNNQVTNYAGVYCEHPSTSFCQSGSKTSAHAFCTNGGECKREVGRTEEHAGCKCPGGYEGNYCQFVEGSKPSDWTLDIFMHPSLASVYGSEQGNAGVTAIFGILIGAGVAFVLMSFVVIGYMYGPSLKNKLRPNEKERQFVAQDTMEADGGVLTEALGDQGLEDVDLDQKTSMEDVDLDDGAPGELA